MPPQDPRAKVTVTLLINAVVEITDDGYLGTEATVKDHIERARTTVNRWSLFVKKGSTSEEHEALPARLTVEAVTVIPKEG